MILLFLSVSDGDTSMNAADNSTLQLPHFLRILQVGLSRRTNSSSAPAAYYIYVRLPDEAACVLCQVAADMYLEDRIVVESFEGGSLCPTQRAKQKEVLTLMMLHSINILTLE
jgi:hypothetical protein